tara:strand:- start:182 stop:730 length:549 start_codon:yes stop_codon:yes gene_type:complete
MMDKNLNNKHTKQLHLGTVLVLSCILLQGCLTRSDIGAGLGATSATMTCMSLGIDNPYIIAMCSLGGGIVGANWMYNSDYDVHYATFVDHLNVATPGSSYTNWYNRDTGNSGIIHTTSLYYKDPFKCVDYSVTVDITSPWPIIGVGNIDRRMEFGSACQLPDGRWVEKPFKNPYTGKWEVRR